MKGFTLIEILLSVAVLLIITGAGYAIYVRYAQNQGLLTAYSNLYNNLNEARSLSLAQVNSSFCSGKILVGYQIAFSYQYFPQSYRFETVCKDSFDKLSFETTRTVQLPSDVIGEANPASVLFLLSGEASLSAEIDPVLEEEAYITLSTEQDLKYLSVEKSGNITGSQQGN